MSMLSSTVNDDDDENKENLPSSPDLYPPVVSSPVLKSHEVAEKHLRKVEPLLAASPNILASKNGLGAKLRPKVGPHPLGVCCVAFTPPHPRHRASGSSTPNSEVSSAGSRKSDRGRVRGTPTILENKDGKLGDNEERLKRESLDGDILKDKTLMFLSGFSRVFDALAERQKPVVGHNLFMDLLFMHEKFYRPLPVKLMEFKKNMNRLFPAIFDTKNMIHREKRRLEDDLGFNFQTTSLSELFDIFDTSKGRFGALYSPQVTFAGAGKYTDKDNRIPHEAGYDSFLAGYVFIRLAHLITTRDVKATEAGPVRFAWYIHSLRSFSNNVNIIRGSIDHLSLDVDQKDPPSRRPQRLVIKSRYKGIPLLPEFVASTLADFGSVDVRPLSSDAVVVAVGTQRVFKDVVAFCATSDKVACYRYRPFIHKPLVRYCLFGILIISGCVSCICLLGIDKL